VLEAAFERAVVSQLLLTGLQPHVGRLSAALQRLHPGDAPEQAKVEELLRAALSGDAAKVLGLSPVQRMIVYSSTFHVVVHHMGASQAEVIRMILDSELIAMAKGWEPALADGTSTEDSDDDSQ
jgi:hypothetical protein